MLPSGVKARDTDQIRRSLAMAEMRLLLASVYSRFRTGVVDGDTKPLEMAERMLTVRSKGLCCWPQFFQLEDQ